MKFLKPKTLFVFIALLCSMASSGAAIAQEVKALPGVNSDIVKSEALATQQVREAIKQHELNYSQYMDVMKQHRDKAADMAVVRRKSNARVKVTLRSQNTQWNGVYDCDDTKANVNPDQVEACDGIDNDCDGDIDEDVTADLFLDADGDGWGDPRQPIKACHLEAGYAARGEDCNDKNIQIYPGAADTPGDGIDANCDGQDG